MIERTIYHVVARRQNTDDATAARCVRAFDSWNWIYKLSGVVPVHCWKFKRDARGVGSDRDLPFLKDVLSQSLSKCGNPFDVVFFTNDDVIVHPLAVREIKRHLELYHAGSMRRVDVDTRDGKTVMPPLYTMPIAFLEAGWPHMGRDAFVFNAGWLKEHLHRIPDFLLGAWGWDIFVAAYIRLMRGHKVENIASMYHTLPDCELPDGLIIHEAHTSKWTEGDDWYNKPANKHNRTLFEAAQKKLFPALTIQAVDQPDWPRDALIRYPERMKWKGDSIEAIAQAL